MIAVDTNLLVYARREDAKFHGEASAAAFLKALASPSVDRLIKHHLRHGARGGRGGTVFIQVGRH
jgi:hypothetical protein